MKRYALLLYILFLAAAVRAATPRPQPLYIVNGKETSEIRSIPPEDIENVEMLPADEETIARYGQRAAHGVMLITLRYDRPADRRPAGARIDRQPPQAARAESRGGSPALASGAEERRAGRKRRRVEHPASRRPAHAAAGGAGHPLTTPLPKPANLICKSP